MYPVQHYFQPTTLAQALALLAAHPQARLVAGGTDLVVELSRGVRPTDTLIDLTRLNELRYLREQDGQLCIGALATHNNLLASHSCVAGALPLAQACLEVGAPQIRARATVAGNLVTGSPANDTIPALVALGAELRLASQSGERPLPLEQFYTGVRRTVLRPGELLREIRVPLLGPRQRGLFLKLGLRRAQAISVVNLAVVLAFDGDGPGAPVATARLALGCVAPTVVRAGTAEAYLAGRVLDEAACHEAGRLAASDAAPIDDLRGSADYRREAVAALVARALRRLAAGEERAGWPARPVLLETGATLAALNNEHAPEAPLETVHSTVNGQPAELSPHKTLLNALREDAGLTGSKVGCAEGECGSCTVWLDGQAAMACLVPAGQAHGRQVTTIEGLAGLDQAAALHPLQAAFVAHGAVQCGYCIPGMLMAGAKLLDEHPRPAVTEVQAALSGNICRCTGYRKIIAAVLAAAEQVGADAGEG